MSRDRMLRVNELMKRELATGLFRVMHEEDFDLAAVSITSVEVAHDLRTARVRVSVRGTAAQQAAAIRHLRKHRIQLQDLVREKVVLKYTPRLLFELDPSIERGDRVLQLLQEIERQHPTDSEGT